MSFQIEPRTPENGVYTFGYLDDNDYNELFSQVLDGVVQAASRLGVRLIRFGYNTSPVDGDSSYDRLLSLIASAELDGLIFLGWTPAALMYNRDHFLKCLPDMPLMSVGTGWPDYPSVYCEGSVHTGQLIRHLIRRHGHRRIAYLPSERPDNRVGVWRETLREHGIWFPELEMEENWEVRGSENRVRRFLEILLDERGLHLDAVISSGQHDTENLMNCLSARGLEVPGDITIAGYTDSDFERYTPPGITTIDYPWSEMGYHACEGLLQLVRTGIVPKLIHVPGRVLYRGSCGCVTDLIHAAAAGPARPESVGLCGMSGEARVRLTTTMREAFPYPEVNFDRLLDALAADLCDPPAHRFLQEFSDTVVDAAPYLRQVRIETLVARFRAAVIPWLLAEPDHLQIGSELFHQAQNLLAGAISQNRGNAGIHAKNLAQAMQETSQAIMTEYDNHAILQALMESLPKLDILYGFVVRYSETGENHECFELDMKKKEIATLSDWTDESLFKRLCRRKPGNFHYQVHPLQVSGRWLGYVIFESGPVDELVYRTLAAHLGTAFVGASMVGRLEDNRRSLVDQAYQEGMADVVAQMLHHIGNVFNSVYASVQTLSEEARSSPVADLVEAETLLSELLNQTAPVNGATDAGASDLSDPRLPKLLKLFHLLGRQAGTHQKAMMKHLNRILEKVRWMDDGITIQQAYAKGGNRQDRTSIVSVLEDALQMHLGALGQKRLVVVKAYHAHPVMRLQRGKLFLVLVFLLERLTQALREDEARASGLRLEVFLSVKECHVTLSVTGQVIALTESVVDQPVGVYGTDRVEDRLRGMDACQSEIQELGGALDIRFDAEHGQVTCHLCFPYDEHDPEGRS